jgi:hypothetical protein
LAKHSIKSRTGVVKQFSFNFASLLKLITANGELKVARKRETAEEIGKEFSWRTKNNNIICALPRTKKQVDKCCLTFYYKFGSYNNELNETN